MFDIHITFPLDQLVPMLAAFGKQFAAQPEEVTVLDWGCTYKLEHAYIVLEWSDEVADTFMEQLTADKTILDFSLFHVPCADDPFSPFTAVKRFMPMCPPWPTDEMSITSFSHHEAEGATEP